MVRSLRVQAFAGWDVWQPGTEHGHRTEIPKPGFFDGEELRAAGGDELAIPRRDFQHLQSRQFLCPAESSVHDAAGCVRQCWSNNKHGKLQPPNTTRLKTDVLDVQDR